jgi:hypothetical protein
MLSRRRRQGRDFIDGTLRYGQIAAALIGVLPDMASQRERRGILCNNPADRLAAGQGAIQFFEAHPSLSPARVHPLDKHKLPLNGHSSVPRCACGHAAQMRQRYGMTFYANSEVGCSPTGPRASRCVRRPFSPFLVSFSPCSTIPATELPFLHLQPVDFKLGHYRFSCCWSLCAVR